jgi:hypothetical protein
VDDKPEYNFTMLVTISKNKLNDNIG